MRIRVELVALFTVVIFWSCTGANPELKVDLKLAGLFGNSMVLQQQTDVAIWGWAAPGQEVVVTSSWGEHTKTQVRSDSTWLARLRTPGASVEQSVNVIAGSDTISIVDVAIGEVWLASGQSNMEMPLSGWPGNPILDSSVEIENSSNSEIRIIMVKRAISIQPVDSVSGDWLASSPKTAPQFSATAYFFAKHLHEMLDVPIGIIHSSWGGTAVDSWISVENLELLNGYNDIRKVISSADTITQNTPTILFNAMIHPLIPFTIKGFLWYQGESDSGNPTAYKEKFTTMIRSWRERWNQDMAPFYFVQIAPFEYGENTESQKLREAQFESMSEPNTGMVVTLDIGNANNIHPANKQDVGKRLALWAAGHTYKKDVIYSGPLFESMDNVGSELLIKFNYDEGGLITGPHGVQNVEIAGPDRQFHPAIASVDSNVLRVSSPQVVNPVAVRYAWNNTSNASLFNSAGLPASSFRSDRWE